MTRPQERTAKGNAILSRATIDGREAVKIEYQSSLPCREMAAEWRAEWYWTDTDTIMDSETREAHGLTNDWTRQPQARR